MVTDTERETLERIRRELPNVVGYSADYQVRIRGGQEVPGSRVLRVYLSRKLPREELRPEEVVPAAVGGCEVDCVAIGEVVACAYLPVLSPPSLYTGRQEVLIGGISLGHGSITAGTLGCFVVKEGHDPSLRSGQVLILTNWHVGKGEAGQVGDVVYQPGPYDIRNVYGEEPGPKYEAGNLDSFANIQEGVVDAALVKPTRRHNPDLFVTPARLSPPVEPVVGMAVLKEGRTTGLTRGTITDTEATLGVSYGGGPSTGSGRRLGQVTFSRCIVIQGKTGAYLAGGDSGSVTRQDAGQPERQAVVGLNFAGTAEGIGIANRMTLVAQALGFEFAPAQPAPPPPVLYAPSNLVEVHFQVAQEVATRLYFQVDKSLYRPAEPVAVSGRLVEEATGQPVAGVTVDAELDGARLGFTTGPDGQMAGAVNGLAPGAHVLKAQFVPV